MLRKLRSFSKAAKEAITHNSPEILLALGVTGSLTTAFLAGQATFKVAKALREHAMMMAASEEGTYLTSLRGILTPRERMEVTLNLCLPVAVSAVLTTTINRAAYLALVKKNKEVLEADELRSDGAESQQAPR